MSAPLTATHVLEYPYERSTGPLQGAFLTALRERRFLGARLSDGRVAVPPPEYDPTDANNPAVDPGQLEEIADTGRVVSWAWCPKGDDRSPLPGRGFAWALVQLDGADTPMLHAVDVDSPADVQVGQRVGARWRDDRVGSITDIMCFLPEASS